MIVGDVNKDGEVDVSDASMIRAHSSQRINISDYLITISADVNHDNDVDISDSSKIIAHIVKGVELK